MTLNTEPASGWVEEIEIENAQIKWAWSHFDGRADTYNDEGDHNFQIILDAEQAKRLSALGWGIKESEGREEGDPPEYLLKAKISFKYEAPKIYLIKGTRKFRAEERDLADIRRSTAERIDVILQPSRWTNGPRTGISAYVKEMYATVKESRFAAMYADLEEI